MSDDWIWDELAKHRSSEHQDDLAAALQRLPRVGPVMEPKLLLLCAEPEYTVDDMVLDKPEVARQWAEQLEREGVHVTVDAIEMSFNAVGGFRAVDGHADHPHVCLTTFVGRLGSHQ